MNKKIFTLFIVFCLQFNFICFAAQSTDWEASDTEISEQEDIISAKNQDILYAKIQIDKHNNEITDVLVDKYLDKSLELPERKTVEIDDLLVNSSLIAENNDLQQNYFKESHIYDNFAEEQLAQYKDVVYPKKIYNFENLNHIIVKICVKKYLSTKYLKKEGEIVDFLAAEDVVQDDKIIIPKNSVIKGRIETISPNFSRGIPADLVIGNFKYGNLKLDGEISRTGASRIYWIVPLAFVANTLMFGTGYILWAIRGGHAKLKPNQIFEIMLSESS